MIIITEQIEQDFVATMDYWKSCCENGIEKVEWGCFHKIAHLHNYCSFCHYYVECEKCPMSSKSICGLMHEGQKTTYMLLFHARENEDEKEVIRCTNIINNTISEFVGKYIIGKTGKPLPNRNDI